MCNEFAGVFPVKRNKDRYAGTRFHCQVPAQIRSSSACCLFSANIMMPGIITSELPKFYKLSANSLFPERIQKPLELRIVVPNFRKPGSSRCDHARSFSGETLPVFGKLLLLTFTTGFFPAMSVSFHGRDSWRVDLGKHRDQGGMEPP